MACNSSLTSFTVSLSFSLVVFSTPITTTSIIRLCFHSSTPQSLMVSAMQIGVMAEAEELAVRMSLIPQWIMASLQLSGSRMSCTRHSTFDAVSPPYPPLTTWCPFTFTYPSSRRTRESPINKTLSSSPFRSEARHW